MEVHSFSKQQQGILCEGEVCIALPSCQLLVDWPDLAIHSLHGTAELGEALRLQCLFLFMQPAVDTQAIYHCAQHRHTSTPRRNGETQALAIWTVMLSSPRAEDRCMALNDGAKETV